MTSAELQFLVESYLREKGLAGDLALTFGDATIIDQKSDIPSRGSITDFRSRLTKEIFLNSPIISANMDTITESRMAIALARLGGIGFIHQFLPLEKLVKEVEKVKRADSGVIENPFTIESSAIVSRARETMNNFHVSGLLVVDEITQKLAGIITSRDIRFETGGDKRVAEVMTRAPLITAPPGTNLEQARLILKKNKIEKLPLVDRENRIVGLITAKDILKIEQFPMALRDVKGRLSAGATVGISGDYLHEAEALIRAGTDIILIDTARGFSTRLEHSIKQLRNILGDIPLVAGNVDTAQGALTLIEAGVDAVKVGIGPGAVCKTREGPGVGIPQLTAIAECAAVCQEFGILLVADGGIRGGADFCKALAAGADAVMMGWMFAGCEETPGKSFYEDGEKWKIYRGSASLEFQISRPDSTRASFDASRSGRVERGEQDDREERERIRASEGVPRRVRYKGEAAQVAEELMSYLRSSMSYVGAWSLEEYHAKAKFRRQTSAGFEEGKPLEK